MQKFLLIALLAFGLLLAGCAGTPPAAPVNASTQANGYSTNETFALNTSSPAPIKNNTNQVIMLNKNNPIVVFETTKGTFEAEIYVNEAPITGNNFMKLVRSGFYNNLTFHRVIPGFMAQGGDPLGTGLGGSNETIPLEIKPNLKHKLGTLAMARSQNPNSASSQFYIVNGEASFLDGSYAVFGQVLGDGMKVVLAFAPGEPPATPDRMLKVYEKK